MGEESPTIFTIESCLKTAYKIGLTTQEFYTMTMKEFEIKIDAYKENFKIQNELADRRTARICMVMANLQRDPKRKSRPYKEEDFIPKPKKKMTIEQMEMLLKAITLANGGEIEE